MNAATGDNGDYGDNAQAGVGKLSLRYRANIISGDSFLVTAETLSPSPPSSPWDDAHERDAIQNEHLYAVRQAIPNSVMVAGLIRTARWPR